MLMTTRFVLPPGSTASRNFSISFAKSFLAVRSTQCSSKPGIVLAFDTAPHARTRWSYGKTPNCKLTCFAA